MDKPHPSNIDKGVLSIGIMGPQGEMPWHHGSVLVLVDRAREQDREDFLAALDEELADVRARLFDLVFGSGHGSDPAEEE